MSVWQIAAFAAVSALLAAVLKKDRAEFALLVQVAAAAVMLLSVLSAGISVFRILTAYSSRVGLEPAYFKLLLRALCMSAAGEWTASFCRDAGLTALSLAVDAGVKLLMVQMCLPLLQTVLDLAAGMFT